MFTGLGERMTVELTALALPTAMTVDATLVPRRLKHRKRQNLLSQLPFQYLCGRRSHCHHLRVHPQHFPRQIPSSAHHHHRRQSCKHHNNGVLPVLHGFVQRWHPHRSMQG